MADEISERHREELESFARLRMQRLTYEECARRLRVSARTLKRWALEPAYAQIWSDLKQYWRDSAQGRVAEAGELAIATLIDLMTGPKTSALVRYYAAKAIGDWAGIGTEAAAKVQDDRDELNEIYRLLAKRPPQVNVQLPPGTLIATPSSTPGEPTAQVLAVRPSPDVLIGEAREA